jgi:hypothetical protein
MGATKNLTPKLEAELERLKRALRLGDYLEVRWVPKEGRLSGEVKGNCIYIYEREATQALEALRHEFLDYVLSQAIEPYKEIANRLILAMSEQAYRRKERVVERLSRLLK